MGLAARGTGRGEREDYRGERTRARGHVPQALDAQCPRLCGPAGLSPQGPPTCELVGVISPWAVDGELHRHPQLIRSFSDLGGRAAMPQ